MEIERGPVTEIEIVKQKLPASGSTPESFSVPRRAICLGLIVYSRTDIVSSGLLPSCRFAGVKNLKWMIRVTTRVISATVNLFRAHIWRQNLLALVILYRENIIPLAQNLNIQRHRLHCQSNTLNVTPSKSERIENNLRWRRFRGNGDRTGRESLELRQPSVPVKNRTLRSQ